MARVGGSVHLGLPGSRCTPEHGQEAWHSAMGGDNGADGSVVQLGSLACFSRRSVCLYVFVSFLVICLSFCVPLFLCVSAHFV